MKRICKTCNFAMRLDPTDKAALVTLAAQVGRSQTDTIRLLIRESGRVLSALQAADYPRPKPGKVKAAPA